MSSDSNIVWAMKSPGEDDVFAQAICRGTWTKGVDCAGCGSSTEKRISPLIIEWVPGSDRVGDFVWPGYGQGLIISERVRALFKERYQFRSFECLPIKMVESASCGRQRSNDKRSSVSSNKIALPYTGLPLWEMSPTATVGVDRARSRFKYEYCAVCDRDFWERDEPHDPMGAVIAEESVRDIDIFASKESAWILCKNSVKRVVESEGFTYIRFDAWGVIKPR